MIYPVRSTQDGEKRSRKSLCAVAETTLGVGKSADGLQSLQRWKDGKIDLIEQYCRRDVEVTREVHRFGCRNGYLLYRDRDGRSIRLPVDWKQGKCHECLDPR